MRIIVSDVDGFAGITVFSVGHLGVKELAAASLGLLHTNVVGISVILGSNSALDTLSKQVCVGVCVCILLLTVLANQAAGSSSPALTSLYALRQLVCQLSMLPVTFVLMWWGSDILGYISPHSDLEMLALTQAYLRIMFWALPVRLLRQATNVSSLD